ncbi:putative N-acetylmannosamine-6-phosphate 2-epimerase [bacterium]|nr:putative N-acetylmannosamine-6-phosphate 2-epimerase [bacterium]
MNEIIPRGLVVSCQAEGDSPFNSPQMIFAFAKAAEMGGAVGVRLEGIKNIEYSAKKISIPIIGIIKGKYENGEVLITPRFEDAKNIVDAGARIIGIDATKRTRPDGSSSYEIIKKIKADLKVSIFADVSTVKEGIDAVEAGANYVGTTLSGYTKYSKKKNDGPVLELVSELSRIVKVPVFCEGMIRNPSDVADALDQGAYGVVVGTVITRPVKIVEIFVKPFKGMSR